MKFGEHLHKNALPEWKDYYLDYDKLKSLIRELEDGESEIVPQDTSHGITFSSGGFLNAAAQPAPLARDKSTTQESFFRLLESEMVKIDRFTRQKVILLSCLNGAIHLLYFLGNRFSKSVKHSKELTLKLKA